MNKGEIIGIFLLILLAGIIIGYWLNYYFETYLLNYYFETKKAVSEYNKKLKYIKSLGFVYNDKSCSFTRGDQMISLIALKDYYSLAEIRRKYY